MLGPFGAALGHGNQLCRGEAAWERGSGSQTSTSSWMEVTAKGAGAPQGAGAGDISLSDVTLARQGLKHTGTCLQPPPLQAARIKAALTQQKAKISLSFNETAKPLPPAKDQSTFVKQLIISPFSPTSLERSQAPQ